ncbi:MAG: hypothetical protein QXL22_04800 [Candidatus Nezhaarchaeales archaeon]
MVSGDLLKASMVKNLKEIKLYITILFNENQELIDSAKNSYSIDRLNSLIGYIMEDIHIWGRVLKLKTNTCSVMTDILTKHL